MNKGPKTQDLYNQDGDGHGHNSAGMGEFIEATATDARRNAQY